MKAHLSAAGVLAATVFLVGACSSSGSGDARSATVTAHVDGKIDTVYVYTGHLPTGSLIQTVETGGSDVSTKIQVPDGETVYILTSANPMGTLYAAGAVVHTRADVTVKGDYSVQWSTDGKGLTAASIDQRRTK